MDVTRSFKAFSDDELTNELRRLARSERHASIQFITCLEEFDRRRTYLVGGFSSIYAYCQQVLHLGEGAAYTRIEVARASRRCPRLLDLVRDGALSLTTASMVARHLSDDDVEALLAEAAFKSKRDVELLIATRHPKPAVPASVRRLPARVTPAAPDHQPTPQERPHIDVVAEQPLGNAGGDRPAVPIAKNKRADAVPEAVGIEVRVAATAAKPSEAESRGPAAAAPAPPLTMAPASRRPLVVPLSAVEYKLQVTIGSASHEQLRAIQDLMRHRLPAGDLGAIVERAIGLLHAQLLKEKAAEVARPRRTRRQADPQGRYVAAAVKRAVYRRDQGRCAFVAADGRRCGSRSGVEFHHVKPYAVGGETTLENLELRCRAHNGLEWTQHLDAANS